MWQIIHFITIKVVAYWNVNHFRVDFFLTFGIIKVVAYWNVNGETPSVDEEASKLK